MSQAVTRIRHALGHAGWAGIAGLVLLAGSLSFGFVLHLDLQGRIAAARLEAGMLNATLRQATTGVHPQSADGEWQQLQAILASPADRHNWPSLLEASANRHGLDLNQAEYTLDREPGSGLVRYRTSLPISGSYPQIRNFLDQVLQSAPAAALDELSLQRESAADEQVEARLRLTLYLRGAR